MNMFFLILFLTGCAQTGKVRLISTPSGADVETKNQSGKYESIGQTPLELSADKFSTATSVRFSKTGHNLETILVIGDPNKLIEVSSELSLKEDGYRSAESAKRLERLARDIITSHNLINQKRYREAQAILQSLSREYPYVSVTYDLLGNISYLERNRSEALQFYEKSFKLNPENSETQSMIERLKDSP